MTEIGSDPNRPDPMADLSKRMLHQKLN